MNEDILHGGAIVPAGTLFSNDANNEYLKRNNINAYIPDNQFYSRDKQLKHQKNKTCCCSMGKEMWQHSEGPAIDGKKKSFFEGKLADCRHCSIKSQCMRNPESADTRKGHGRQVSITFTNGWVGTD